MFRNRFNDAFPKSLAHFGPQELERDVVEPIPGDRVEHFLCALLGLLLNRKQDVKYGRCKSKVDNLLMNLFLQTRALRSSIGGCDQYSQEPMAVGVGRQDSSVRRCNLHLHEPYRKSIFASLRCSTQLLMPLPAYSITKPRSLVACVLGCCQGPNQPGL